jgi:TolB protein
MHADGSYVMRLTNTSDPSLQSVLLCSGPAWSPDSTKIVFELFIAGTYDLYTMNAVGGNVMMLTNNADLNLLPAWSPDGKKIAFTAVRGEHFDIFVMDAEGRTIQKLTDNPAIDRWPAWSPDSKKICFESNRDGNFDIYVMNADGSNVQKFTDNPADDIHPAWYTQAQSTGFFVQWSFVVLMVVIVGIVVWKLIKSRFKHFFRKKNN